MVKAGMNSLCRTLAAEEKDNGVGVWAVRPGMIDVRPLSFHLMFKVSADLEFPDIGKRYIWISPGEPLSEYDR